MKTFKNPEITDFKYTIKTREERIKFDAIWKQIVKEDRASKYASKFASLSIIRNLMLGRSMYHGFTPSYNYGRIRNGMPYNHGWHQAYLSAWGALRYNKEMADYTMRMLEAVGVKPESKLTDLGLPKPTSFDASLVCVEAEINKMIIHVQDLHPAKYMHRLSYDDLYNMYEYVQKEEARATG